MEIRFTRSGALEDLESLVSELSRHPEVEGILILAAAANPLPEDPFRVFLGQCSLPIFGGIFPQIIAEGDAHSTGFLVLGLRCAPRLKVVFGLNNRPSGSTEDLVGLPDSDAPEKSTLFTIVDGRSGGIDGFLKDLYATYGAQISYLGGGAGSLERVDWPCVFTNEGFFRDSAILAQLDLMSGVGVAHGMQVVGQSFLATESWQNKLQTLDWEPAFDVYREQLQTYGEVQGTPRTLLEKSREYAFGLSRSAAGEMVVRDPMFVGSDKEIICAGAIPRGCKINILKGEVDSFIKAAGSARQQAQKNYPGETPPVAILVFTCYSREIYLGDRFCEEIAAITEDETPVVGATTIGEIANLGQHYLEFLNKTVVAAQVRCRFSP